MSGLIQTLGDLKDYNVISRQTVAATVDALQLASVAPIPYGTAQEVGASYLVSGSFRREGAWLVLDCELTNVAREGVVVDTWSVELADSARIQEAVVELAVNVAGALHASWTQDPRTAPSTRPTASTAALKHYQRGLDHEERHEYAEAVVEFFKAVKDDSTFAEAHFGIARLTMEKDVEQKHYTLAMKYRLRAPPLTRKIIEAQGLVWDNQLDPAIEKFEEILREDPEQVTARKELAQLYSARRRFSEAFAEYAVLHEISPLDYSFYQSWSVAAVLNGKPDQAVALLGDWRRRFPEQEQPFVAYLSLCYQLSRIGEGTALCDSVAGIDPETLPFACGWLYERAGRLNEAEAIFSRLVASPDPGLPSTRGNAYMAWLSYRRQEYVRGLGYIDNALEKWDNTWYRWLAGSLAAGAGRIDEAREHARAILRLDPQSADTTVAGAMGNQRWYFDLLGLIDLAEGRPRDAAAEFRKALRFSTVFDDPEYRTHLGRAYLEAGDLDAAARELATVWTATPTFPQAWLYLGKTYVEQGDYENAMEVLRNLEDLWRRADADDPLNLELERLMDLASNR
jgi:tetratricopeptide (TPR) repeat protein